MVLLCSFFCYWNLTSFCAQQARGLKKHLKRLNAPKHWMLDKLGGAFVRQQCRITCISASASDICVFSFMTLYVSFLQAPKPSSGPHKSRECLPLILILRNRLKYALTYREVIAILMQRHVLVDGKVRTDKTYPSGFMGKIIVSNSDLYALIPFICFHVYTRQYKLLISLQPLGFVRYIL